MPRLPASRWLKTLLADPRVGVRWALVAATATMTAACAAGPRPQTAPVPVPVASSQQVAEAALAAAKDPETPAEAVEALRLYAASEEVAWAAVDPAFRASSGGAAWTPPGTQKSTAAAAPPDPVFTPELVAQCASFLAEIKEAAAKGEEASMAALLGSVKCRAIRDTSAVTITTNADGNPDLTNIESAKITDEAKVKAVCGAITSKVSFNLTSDPTVAMIAGPLGAYSCGSYLNAIRRLDPLLILAPGLIPQIDLAQDAYDEVQRAITRVKSDPKAVAVVGVAMPGVVIAVASFDAAKSVARSVLKPTAKLATQSLGLFSMAGRALPRVTLATPKVVVKAPELTVGTPKVTIPINITLPKCYKVMGTKVCP